MKKKLVAILVLLLLIILFSSLYFIITNKQEKNIEVKPDPNHHQKVEIKEPEEPVETLNITSNINISENKDLEAFFKTFFDSYYKSLADLELTDTTYMFSNLENAKVYKTALELLITTRKEKDHDLKINDIIYTLTVDKYKEENNKITIVLYENCQYKFNFIKDVESKIYNIKNTFTLVKDENSYKIDYYNKVQDFYVMITDYYKIGSQGNYEEKIDQIKENYLEVFKTENAKILDMQTNYLNNNYTKLTCDHAYDRESAYNYATNWVGKRNPRWARFGANCVNYVSQVMYNGGIPMDYYGDYQWKFYDSHKNDNNTASGFTYSWTWVPALTNYFKYNKGYGLCGKYNENLYLGEKGDVVVVGTKGADRHVITVIDQVKEDGKVIDLLVNSNTVDLENFPLSAYAYPYKVLLKVYGWNEK